MNLWFEKLQKVYETIENEQIFINNNKIKKLAKKLANQKIQEPNWRQEIYPEDDFSFVQFLGISTSINACYSAPLSTKKFSTYWHGKLWVGADALCASFMSAMDDGVPILNAEFLAELKLDIFKKYFTGIPLLEKRYLALKSVGHILEKKYEGHFINLIKAGNYKCFDKGNGICERLSQDFSWMYRDVHYTRDFDAIPFYKKVLLFALMYEGRARDSQYLKTLQDPQSISPIVDYQIPKILHHEGVLVYNPDINIVIEKRIELPEYGKTETAIRLNTAIAWGKLLIEINKIRKKQWKKPIDMIGLDYLLWLSGRKLKSEEHHRTLTMNY